MVRLNPVVEVLSVQVSNSIVRPIPEVHFLDHSDMAVGLVGDERHRLIAANGLAGLAYECPYRARISSRNWPKVDQLVCSRLNRRFIYPSQQYLLFHYGTYWSGLFGKAQAHCVFCFGWGGEGGFIKYR